MIFSIVALMFGVNGSVNNINVSCILDDYRVTDQELSGYIPDPDKVVVIDSGNFYPVPHKYIVKAYKSLGDKKYVMIDASEYLESRKIQKNIQYLVRVCFTSTDDPLDEIQYKRALSKITYTAEYHDEKRFYSIFSGQLGVRKGDPSKSIPFILETDINPDKIYVLHSTAE